MKERVKEMIMETKKCNELLDINKDKLYTMQALTASDDIMKVILEEIYA